MIPSPISVDASVLLKWYLSEDEPFRDRALLLFERFWAGQVRIFLPETLKGIPDRNLSGNSQAYLIASGDVLLITD